jgi:hypothetical protein
MTTSELAVVDAEAEPQPITVVNNHTLYNGDVVADCAFTVMCQREQADGTHVMDVEIRRHDGMTYTASIDGVMLEDEKKLNAMGSSVARANFFFRAKNGSLAALKQYLHAQPGNEHVVIDVAQAGWNNRYCCWFGEMGMVDANGKWYPWTSTGVRAPCRDRATSSYRMKTFNLRRDPFGPDIPVIDRPGHIMGSVYELKPKGLFRTEAGTQPVAVSDSEPTIDEALDEALAKARTHIQQVIALWSENIGNFGGAIGIGYMTAASIRHHAESYERLFPHLYITGRTQFGKDTLARILALTTGMNINSVTSGGRGTTEKSVRNKLASVGNTPLWLNELRSDTSDYLKSLIRTSSDFQSNTITDIKQRNVVFQANRPMMLVGEVLIGNDAEHSRYVVLRINTRPTNKSVLRQLEASASRCSSHWSQFLCDHNRAAWQIALAAEKLRPEFMARGCDSRRARGWSLTAAGIAYWFSPDCHIAPAECIPEQIMEELFARAAEAMQYAVDDGVNAEFWSICQSVRASGDLSNSASSRWARSYVDPESRRVNVAIWTAHIIRSISKASPKEMPARGLILNELRADPGFLGTRNVRCGGEQRACYVYDKQTCNLPQWVLDSADEHYAKDDVVMSPAADEPY